MKKTQKTLGAFLLCATLAAFAGGCQKETIEDPIVREAQIGEERTVFYSIDGTDFSIKLYGDDAWNDFVRRMVALSKEGHRVSFRVGGFLTTNASAKETVTFTTSDYNEAVTWGNNMGNQGYSVTIVYDKDKDLYICIAVK